MGLSADDVKGVREIVQHLFTNIVTPARSKQDSRQAKTHVECNTSALYTCMPQGANHPPSPTHAFGSFGLKVSVTESECLRIDICKIYKWIYVNTYICIYIYIREQGDWRRDPGRCALFYFV